MGGRVERSRRVGFPAGLSDGRAVGRLGRSPQVVDSPVQTGGVVLGAVLTRKEPPPSHRFLRGR